MSSVAVARVKATAFAVPAWMWVAGLVVVSAGLRYGFARHMVGPWIVIDEIVYSELARSIAAGEGLSVRDAPVGTGFGVVYPLLVSPAYLLDSLPAAYAAAKAINALLVSLAAVPAYLLARRVVSAPLALVAATLAVALPSLVYAGTLMTENAFYPLFLVSVLLLVRALERPTLARTAVLLAAVGVAFLTRAQAMLFVPAIVTAPLVLAVWEGRARTIWAYRTLFGGLAAAAGLVLAVAAAGGRTPVELLGAYRAAGEAHYRAEDVLRWLLYHVGELDLYVGIAPFAAFLLLLLQPSRLDRAERFFLAGAAAAAGWLVLQVAAFASLPSVWRIEERNMFYAAPLLFTGLLLWIERGAPRPPLRTAAALAAAAALPVFIPYRDLIRESAVADTLALLPLWTLHEVGGVPLDRIWLVVIGGAVALAALVALVPARAALVLPGLALVLFALQAEPVDARTQKASTGALFQGLARPERDWVDREVGRDAQVAVLWTSRTDRMTVFQNEFFSRSLRRVYHLRDPVPGGLAQMPLSVDAADGLLRDPAGGAVRAPYLLTDDSLPIAGDVVARDRRKGILVYRLEGPVRLDNVTAGVYDDAWTGPAFEYRGFRCRERSLLVRLGSDPNLFRRSQTVTALVGGRPVARVRVRPEIEETVLSVPLGRDAGRCVVRFAVAPTAVPARVQRGSEDTRRLGVRVLGFDRR